MSGCATEECKCNTKTGSLDLFMFTTLLAQEVERADLKHGDWIGMNPEWMVAQINSELNEVDKAIDFNDINGEHGMKAELIQVACTAYKMWRAL